MLEPTELLLLMVAKSCQPIRSTNHGNIVSAYGSLDRLRCLRRQHGHPRQNSTHLKDTGTSFGYGKGRA